MFVLTISVLAIIVYGLSMRGKLIQYVPLSQKEDDDLQLLELQEFKRGKRNSQRQNSEKNKQQKQSQDKSKSTQEFPKDIREQLDQR